MLFLQLIIYFKKVILVDDIKKKEDFIEDMVTLLNNVCKDFEKKYKNEIDYQTFSIDMKILIDKYIRNMNQQNIPNIVFCGDFREKLKNTMKNNSDKSFKDIIADTKDNDFKEKLIVFRNELEDFLENYSYTTFNEMFGQIVDEELKMVLKKIYDEIFDEIYMRVIEIITNDENVQNPPSNSQEQQENVKDLCLCQNLSNEEVIIHQACTSNKCNKELQTLTIGSNSRKRSKQLSNISSLKNSSSSSYDTTFKKKRLDTEINYNLHYIGPNPSTSSFERDEELSLVVDSGDGGNVDDTNDANILNVTTKYKEILVYELKTLYKVFDNLIKIYGFVENPFIPISRDEITTIDSFGNVLEKIKKYLKIRNFKRHEMTFEFKEVNFYIPKLDEEPKGPFMDACFASLCQVASKYSDGLIIENLIKILIYRLKTIKLDLNEKKSCVLFVLYNYDGTNNKQLIEFILSILILLDRVTNDNLEYINILIKHSMYVNFYVCEDASIRFKNYGNIPTQFIQDNNDCLFICNFFNYNLKNDKRKLSNKLNQEGLYDYDEHFFAKYDKKIIQYIYELSYTLFDRITFKE